MRLIVGGVMALVAVVIVTRMRAPAVSAHTLGCMSEQCGMYEGCESDEQLVSANRGETSEA